MNYSLDEHHSFSCNIAKLTGSVPAAVLFSNLIFWLKHNAALGLNQFEGMIWFYHSIAQYQQHFPYLSKHEIQTGLDKLIEHKLIIKSKFNKDPFDHTTWYTVCDQSLIKLPKLNLDDDLDEPRESHNPQDSKKVSNEIPKDIQKKFTISGFQKSQGKDFRNRFPDFGKSIGYIENANIKKHSIAAHESREDPQKLELLEPYDISPEMLPALLCLPIDQIKNNIELVKEKAKRKPPNNLAGMVISALRGNWANEKMPDKVIKAKQDEPIPKSIPLVDPRVKIDQENKKCAERLLEKYKDKVPASISISMDNDGVRFTYKNKVSQESQATIAMWNISEYKFISTLEGLGVRL